MFEDYKLAVLQFYKTKKRTHQLTAALENPERHKLRKECLRILSGKNSRADIDIVNAFFNPVGKYDDHVKSIENFELDKFRPLMNFITKEKGIRDDAAVKLLAWMIDFYSYTDWRNRIDANIEFSRAQTHRPETPVHDHINGASPAAEEPVSHMEPKATEDTAVITPIPAEKKVTTEGHTGLKIRRPVMTRYMVASAGVMVLLGGYILFTSGLFNSRIREPLPAEQCMYWTGNHYQPVSCRVKTSGTIPLDRNILLQQQKIGWPDTLTRQSVGKIWYAKNRGRYEFFTAGGIYPADTAKRLRPLTPYILDRHVFRYRFILTLSIWILSVLAFIFLLVRLMQHGRRPGVKDAQGTSRPVLDLASTFPDLAKPGVPA